MNTAVLIHGCHMQAEGLEDIIWGDPENDVLGRVPKGLLEAWKHNADTIIFSTGASKKDGLPEGEYILQYAMTHLPALSPLIRGWNEDAFRRWLLARAALELTSTDTRTEILASARLAKERGAKQLILVSSPSHILRCHKEAISILSKDPDLRFLTRNLYAVAADTCFRGTTVDDVVVIEPPHRGDTPKVPFYRTAKGIFPLLRDANVAFQFNGAWATLIEKYQKKLAQAA